ncbi:M1 family aminopeptidase [Mesonia sp. K4-1]|uniref:M1 family aminopeptidase n=1 Tax=Mesonia sp. K4-1 TaxID=2602760 RepID=UPI0011C8BF72|nr:M1 family aminopeptidase [Mesonia sp. K4-1]TXK72934.1 T9SS type A sorting domain-containing protein [Mesonia sp. K4-1]
MKYSYLFLFFIIFQSAFAQQLVDEDFEICKAERLSAEKRIQFVSNSNTGNYDVNTQELNLQLDPSVAYIEGVITTTFTAKQSLSSIIFDLAANMQVNEVTNSSNQTLSHSRSGDELIINLNSTLAAGQTYTLSIDYEGNPIRSGFGSFEQTTHNGHEVIWTLSEPYGAKAWWPCKQDLNDKIESVDIFLTVPRFNSNNEENIPVANGLEVSNSFIGNSKTVHFSHDYPIPAYLIAVAVTNYAVINNNYSFNGMNFPLIDYVYPEDLASATQDLQETAPILNLFSTLFGNYPYENEKYGHAQFGWGGGMEHTTISFMGNFSRGLIAHEMAHQWFGDKVTCGSWKDIWLNEGFATYLSGLVVEDFDGASAFNNWKESKVLQITSQPDGAVYLSDNDTLSVGRIFSGRLSYSKGAMVLHMLRKKLGDADFYQATQNYLDDPALAYGYAKTPDFRQKLEQQSGLSLTEFFDDWIYGEGFPTFSAYVTQPTSSSVNLTLNQTQSHPSVSFFETLLPVRLLGANGEILDTTVEHTSNNQQFTIPVNFTVVDVEIDPQYDVITLNSTANLSISNAKAELFKVYPNPAQDKIYFSQVQKPIQHIEIFDLNGRSVITEKQNFKEVNVESLSQGIYLLKVNFEDATSTTKKLIKE